MKKIIKTKEKAFIKLLNYTSFEINTWYNIKSDSMYRLPYVFNEIEVYGEGILMPTYNRYISIVNKMKNKTIKISLPCKFLVELKNGKFYVCTYKVNFCKELVLENTITYKNLFEPNILPCMDIENDFFEDVTTNYKIPIKEIKRYMLIEISKANILYDMIDNLINLYRKNNNSNLNKYFLPINKKPENCKECLYSPQCKIFDINKCPIVEIPNYRNEYEKDIIEHESYDLGRNKGFNECLDIILKKNSNNKTRNIIEDEEDFGVQGEVYNDL